MQNTLLEPRWGPIGEAVYSRTYSRDKPNGEKETWFDTCHRFAAGNCAFVEPKFLQPGEQDELFNLVYNFNAIPGGRHLWVTGVPGRQFIMNCHLAGWGEKLSDHFCFTFNELMKGGGVGANYSNRHIEKYRAPQNYIKLNIICRADHPDYNSLIELGLIEPTTNTAGMLTSINGIYFRPDDSREGWVECSRLIVDLHLNQGDFDSHDNNLTIDLSNIREKGRLIKGFGGVASGPWALARLLHSVNNLLNKRSGKKLTSLDMMEVDYLQADCVISGNVRRCIAKDSIVQTNSGFKKIQDIKIGDEVVTSDGFNKVTGVFHQGVQNTIKITHQAGEIEVTPNHKLAVLSSIDEYEFKQVKDLKIDDRLVFVSKETNGIHTSLPSFSFVKKPHTTIIQDIKIPSLDEGIAWLFGVFFGDGCAYLHNRAIGGSSYVSISFSLNEPELAQKAKVELEKFGVKVNINQTKDNTYRVLVNSRQLAEYFSNFKKPHTTILIPDFITSATPRIRSAFLAGLFDSDGSCKTRPLDLITTIYENFAKEVLDIYRSLGIPARMKKLYMSKEDLNKGWKQKYSINSVGSYTKQLCIDKIMTQSLKYISDESYVSGKNDYSFPSNFVENINYRRKWSGPSVCDSMCVATLERCIDNKIDLIPSKIISIETGRSIETFDIEVENKHEFMVEGCLSHNSARMSIKCWRDSDIFDFITCKVKDGKHNNTNISVEIDDEFIAELNYPGSHAQKVYQAVIRGMLLNGEPGFWNRSLSTKFEPDIEGTNPCGEECLIPFDACNLGHLNMAKFYDNFEGLKRAGYIMSRALLRATFCDIEDPKQRAAVDKKRRIGVGVFSYQEWCCKQGIKYSQSWKNNLIRNKLKELFQTIRVAADSYADEMGIPRPATVTTLAPTGSISNLPGGQGGAQTIFALYYYRKVRYAANDSLLDNLAARGLFIEDCVYTANTKVVRFVCEDRLVSEINSMGLNADELVEGASEVSLRDYLSIQAMFQECYVDNAISFTINTLPGQYTQKFVEETLKEFLPRLKGTTIMVDGSRAQSPFERISRREYLELTGGFGEIGSVLEECKNGSCPVR